MNEHKISFIICTNQDYLLEECQLYLNHLTIPDGYCTDIITIRNASSITSAYNQAIKQSDAKYKIYLHQDVFIINTNFIHDVLKLFISHPDIGMIGMIGNTSIADNGCPWGNPRQNSRRIGKVFTDFVYKCALYSFQEFDCEYHPAVVIDGLLMATQYDIPWRENLFPGFHFYDASQSMEFLRAGYQVVIPRQDTPWCYHDNDITDRTDYEYYRCILNRNTRMIIENWTTALKSEVPSDIPGQVYQFSCGPGKPQSSSTVPVAAAAARSDKDYHDIRETTPLHSAASYR